MHSYNKTKHNMNFPIILNLDLYVCMGVCIEARGERKEYYISLRQDEREAKLTER